MKSEAVTFIRIIISFAQLRATNLCIRGYTRYDLSTVNTRELDLGLVNCESQCVNNNNGNFKIQMLDLKNVFT